MACKHKVCEHTCCYECQHQKECFKNDEGCNYFKDLEFTFDKNWKDCINYRKDKMKL